MWVWSEGWRSRRRSTPAWPRKNWESGRDNASQAPAFSLIVDPGQKSLQTTPALTLWLDYLNDCLTSTGCKTGWRRSNSEKGTCLPYAIFGEFSWALCYTYRCCRFTAQTTIIVVFSNATANQETAVMLQYIGVFFPEVFIEAFCWTKSLRLFFF